MLVVLYFLLAVIEFFLINWLGRHSVSSGYYQISFIQTLEDAPLFNAVFRILAPSVYLVLTASAWYAVGFDQLLSHYWLVTVLYFLVRWAFNVVLGRAALLNWLKQIGIAVLAIGLSFIVSSKLVESPHLLLPSPQGLTDQLWIAILGFLYLTAARVRWPQVGASADQRRIAYLRSRHTLYKRRYGSLVRAHSSELGAEVLSYSILIYESFNRPRVYQAIERHLLFPMGLADTLGPMQVRTSMPLDDQTLVRIGVEKVNQAFQRAFDQLRREDPRGLTMVLRGGLDSGAEIPFDPDFDVSSVRFADVWPFYQGRIVSLAAEDYNVRSDYPGEVLGIFEVLRDEHYPELNPLLARQRSPHSLRA